MSRRKGERPVAKPLEHFTDEHPVARAIREGDYWMQAWLVRASTPYARLARTAGIPVARLSTINTRGAEVSRAEVDALARAWAVSSEDLTRSIDGACPIID